jgi:outer membrane protein OmpA-like peptidoglycan-associated protein
MTSHMPSRGLLVLAASVLTTLLNACGEAQPLIAEERVVVAPVHAYRIAQTQRGGTASFGACDDCAKPTPKTLRSRAQIPVVSVTSRTSAQEANAANSQDGASAVGTETPQEARLRSTEEPSRVASPEAMTRAVAMVQFAQDSDGLTEDSVSRLEQLLPLLRAAARIKVVGYTDSLGQTTANDNLAKARALMVMLKVRHLLAAGQGSTELTATGRAMCCYISNNRSKVARAQNRRAEIFLELPQSAATARLVADMRPHLSVKFAQEATEQPRTAAKRLMATRLNAGMGDRATDAAFELGYGINRDEPRQPAQTKAVP